MSKISYATYIKDRIDGFSGESERRAPADLDDFPEYKEKIAKSGGTPTYTRPCCTNELKVKDETSLLQDINNFKNSLDKLNHRHAFMNSASPGVINVFMPNKFYSTEDEYLDKLSNIMAKEYELITKSDIQVQLDCPDLALARHMNFKNLSEDEFIKRAELQIECLNSALSNVDVEQTRMHICWGNYEGPHTHDIALEKILPLVPGVIDSTSNFVEHPEVVADRLIQFSTVIPKDQLMAGTDCGFSTFAGFGKIDEKICYEKLHALVEGTKLASKVI